MTLLAESGAQDPLLPSMPELIIGGFAFFVVFGVLGKILLPRIQETLAERTDQIEGGLRRAEEAQAEAQRTLTLYQEQLAEARHDAVRLREDAREQGVRIIAELREQAQADARRLTEVAHAQIESERQQVRTELRAEMGALAVELAGRIVGESLADAARRSRTIDRFLEELEAQSATVESSG